MHENYKKANAAPRCLHIRFDNQPCTQPALHGRTLCRFHFGLGDIRASFPMIEDGLSLQVALNQVTRGILNGDVDHKTAKLLLYSLQIMCSNLKRINEDRQLAQAEVSNDTSVPAPSAAEILLDRLELTDEPPAADLSSRANSSDSLLPLADCERDTAVPSETQDSVAPVVNPSSPWCGPSAPLRHAPQRPSAVTDDSGVVDKIEACAPTRASLSWCQPSNPRGSVAPIWGHLSPSR